MTMIERLLKIAEDLVRDGERSSASKRRAISTAYYALFHSLAKLCADTLVGAPEVGTMEYERVYRALDHGPMKKAFNTAILKQAPKIAKVGATVVALQSERHKSDYLPPSRGLYSRSKCEELVARAKSAIAQLGELSERERLLLATCLLFKDRSQ